MGTTFGMLRWRICVSTTNFIQCGPLDDHSMWTVRRWIRQYNLAGTALSKRAPGNRHSTREVHGADLVNFALFWLLVHPKAYIDEVRAFMHNQNPVNLPYSQLQSVRAEHRPGLTRKVASSTSD